MDNIPSYPLYFDPNLFAIPEVPSLSYREIIVNKINQITTVGFTIDEFQKAMVILCLIRFIIYSIRYNPITSFKICAIGSVSCFLWALTLNACVRFHYLNGTMDYCRLLKRISIEEEEYREMAKIIGTAKYVEDYWKKATGEMSPYHFEWVRPIFNLVPDRYSHITDPIYEYIRTDLYSLLKKFYKARIRSLMPMAMYTGVTRLGKKYCPYHVRWHATFIMMTLPIQTWIFSCTARAKHLMIHKLIPNRRFIDAENLRVNLGAIAFLQISFCMYAMLHAIFSQYFYIPFFVQNTELHVGTRNKKSIYSGGYTAWQDAFVFYDLNFRESMRLWWGFLGRGTKRDRRKKRKKRKKK